MSLVTFFQQKASVLTENKHLAMLDRDTDETQSWEMRHDETWKLEGQPRQDKCRYWAKIETWKTMSWDSLETRHVSRDSVTASYRLRVLFFANLRRCLFLVRRTGATLNVSQLLSSSLSADIDRTQRRAGSLVHRKGSASCKMHAKQLDRCLMD